MPKSKSFTQMKDNMVNKKAQKNIDRIKQANHQCSQVLDHLMTTYTFTTQEEKAVKDIQAHLFNMSQLMNDIASNKK